MKDEAVYEALLYLEVGRRAIVHRVLTHPRLGEPDLTGEGYVRTSPVVCVLDNGAFETVNTIYRPAAVS